MTYTKQGIAFGLAVVFVGAVLAATLLHGLAQGARLELAPVFLAAGVTAVAWMRTQQGSRYCG